MQTNCSQTTSGYIRKPEYRVAMAYVPWQNFGTLYDPDDQDALKAFRQYEDARRSAMNAYSEQYGPLTMDTASPCSHWYWATEAWPWEGGRI